MRIIPLLIALLFLFFNYSNCQLYDSTLNTRVNINGHPHFKIDYYPGTTDTNYKGHFYPDVETNTNVKKYTFISSCTVNAVTNFASILTPALNTVDNPNGRIVDENTVLIIPSGVTVTFAYQPDIISTILVKGRLLLNPTTECRYMVSKTIIFPGGVFESVPTTPSYNHTLALFNFDDHPTWDPLHTASFISLGGNVTIRGLDTDSVWTGTNSSFSTYGGTFHRSFPFSPNIPVFKLGGTKDSSNNIAYSMNSYYTGLNTPAVGSPANQYAYEPAFSGAGYIYMRPWGKNVWINGYYETSMVFTGSSTVDIQNAVFRDMGHTTQSPLNDHVLDSSYNVISYGTNPPDRYPLTLLHNKLSVNIRNNMFIPISNYNTPNNQQSKITRCYIGVRRSFGNIIGNAFVLQRSISGISLLHGTEQFDISLNAFISVYTDTTTVSTFRSYPDIDYLNSGIITTSPFSTYENNAFEGMFKGGAIQIIPIQNRATATGLTTDQLLGTYSGLTQDNTDNIKTNHVWNSLVYKGNFFAGEAEFRVRYPSSAEPPIKFNLFGGWYIGQRASLTLGSIGNQANIELFYDSPYIASSLSINDNLNIQTETNTHTGKYNSISIKNAISIASYKFFSDAFTCGYLSITDSTFSHFSNSDGFIKKYANQVYVHKVNGTKVDGYYALRVFRPLFKFSNNLLASNILSMTFIPNFDFSYSNNQKVFYVVNDQVVDSLPSDIFPLANYVVNQTETLRTISFGASANGLYSVLISSKQYFPVLPTLYTQAGPYFWVTHIIDSSTNFYLGIDLTPDVEVTKRALSIFANQWTKCGWVSGICTTTGSLSKVVTAPTSISDSTNTNTRTLPDEISMLTSYLVHNSMVRSTVNITLPASKTFKFFIYSYNPTYTSANILDRLPLFTIKINGKYQEPYTRTISPYQKYQKFGPFYWNSGTTDVKLSIEWATDTPYLVPICGIEIHSNIATPYTIPITP